MLHACACFCICKAKSLPKYLSIAACKIYNKGVNATATINDYGISINGNNNTVYGCYVGTNNLGTLKGGTTLDLAINVNGNDNKIGDGTAASANLISGMNGNLYGIRVTGTSTRNTIKGNMIGLQRDGVLIMNGNSTFAGVYFTGTATNNTLGGTVLGEGNVVSGNSSTNGAGVYSNSPNSNTILGNIIGPQANGTTVVASSTQTNGIYLIDSPNNIIGGTTAAERNIISANASYGIYMSGSLTTGNQIKGNYIGIDKTGTTFITSNTQDIGVYLLSSCGSNNIIGGSRISVIGKGNVVGGANNTLQGDFNNISATASGDGHAGAAPSSGVATGVPVSADEFLGNQ